MTRLDTFFQIAFYKTVPSRQELASTMLVHRQPLLPNPVIDRVANYRCVEDIGIE